MRVNFLSTGPLEEEAELLEMARPHQRLEHEPMLHEPELRERGSSLRVETFVPIGRPPSVIPPVTTSK